MARVPVSATPLTSWEALGFESSAPLPSAVLHLSSSSDPSSQMRKPRLEEGTRLSSSGTCRLQGGLSPWPAQERPRECLLLTKAQDPPPSGPLVASVFHDPEAPSQGLLLHFPLGSAFQLVWSESWGSTL